MAIIFLEFVPYFIAMLLPILFFIWYLRGFLGPYMKVRASRGGKILVKVHTVYSHYFCSGVIVDDFLVYNRKDKKEVRVSIKKATEPVVDDKTNKPTSVKPVFYRMLGVGCIDTDEKTGAIILPDYSVVSGFDPVMFENLNVRAATTPAVDGSDEAKHKKLVLIGLVVLLVAIIIVGILVFGVSSGVDELKTVCIPVSEAVI